MTAVNPLECNGNYGATSNNSKVVQWLLMGARAVDLVQQLDGTGRGRSPPRLLLAVPNVTAHQSTTSVPASFNVALLPLNNSEAIIVPHF